MSTAFFSEPVLTELDYVRLSALVRQHPSADLTAPLDEAEVVPTRLVPHTVATMYSRLRVRDDITGLVRVLTICYPQDTDPDRGYVSVASPVGARLLGRSAGSAIAWTGPDGRARSMRVEELLFQPESSGSQQA